jgi:methylmalonyl-CoA mutase N-terminal domain/subunit
VTASQASHGRIHDQEDMAGSADSDVQLSTANDAEAPIRWRYAHSYAHAPLERWAAARALTPPPYRPRTMAYVGMGLPEQTAERLRLLQASGAESFLIAADLPSQLGIDPTHRLSRAQVGRAGMTCSTLDDLIRACSKLDFDRVDSFGMLANSVGHVGLGMVLEMLRHYGASHVKVMMQNDPLKEFTARGTEIYDAAKSVRIACDCVEYAIDNSVPGWAMSVCSNHYDVAGAGPVVAMAIALSNAIAYVDELVARGRAIADIQKKIMFFFNERSNLFLSASIFRMGRVLWSEILSDRYSLPLDEQVPAVLMGYAHGLETAKEPLVNVVRSTLSVAGSVLGGVDYLCTSSYDEPLRIPSADAAVLAVRTLEVVGMEHGIAETVDALAGSEKLAETDEHVYASVKDELARIMQTGGAVAGLENGYIASLIDDRRGTRERQLDAGERDWVGVNVLDSAESAALLTGQSSGEVDFDAVERAAIQRCQELTAGRNTDQLAGALADVEHAAAAAGNLVPPSIKALQVHATIGEIIDATSRGFNR